MLWDFRKHPHGSYGCLYLVMVPLKELQEAGLGACGPLDSTETKIIAGSLQVPHIHHQILQPQTRSLPHCGQLGRPVQRGGEGHSGCV